MPSRGKAQVGVKRCEGGHFSAAMDGLFKIAKTRGKLGMPTGLFLDKVLTLS